MKHPIFPGSLTSCSARSLHLVSNVWTRDGRDTSFCTNDAKWCEHVVEPCRNMAQQYEHFVERRAIGNTQLVFYTDSAKSTESTCRGRTRFCTLHFKGAKNGLDDFAPAFCTGFAQPPKDRISTKRCTISLVLWIRWLSLPTPTPAAILDFGCRTDREWMP